MQCIFNQLQLLNKRFYCFYPWLQWVFSSSLFFLLCRVPPLCCLFVCVSVKNLVRIITIQPNNLQKTGLNLHNNNVMMQRCKGDMCIVLKTTPFQIESWGLVCLCIQLSQRREVTSAWPGKTSSRGMGRSGFSPPHCPSQSLEIQQETACQFWQLLDGIILLHLWVWRSWASYVRIVISPVM